MDLTEVTLEMILTATLQHKQMPRGKLPILYRPDCKAILKERATELTLWLNAGISSMFLTTEIRMSNSVDISILRKFLNKSKYEDWVNDEFGSRFADFEMEGKKYKIVFYSKKMDFSEFSDWGNQEYMLMVLS